MIDLNNLMMKRQKHKLKQYNFLKMILNLGGKIQVIN